MTKTKPLPILLAGIAVLALAITTFQLTRPPKQNPATTQAPQLIQPPATPEQPKPETINPDIDTTNWKTYRNEEYGFELKYPEDWKLDESSNVNSKTALPKDALFQVDFDPSLEKDSNYIGVIIYPLNYASEGMQVGTQKEPVSISGMNGNKYTLKRNAEESIGGRNISIHVELKSENKQFHIEYLADYDDKRSEQIFENMIHQFKLL